MPLPSSEDGESTTIYVKNLAFATTDAGLQVISVPQSLATALPTDLLQGSAIKSFATLLLPHGSMGCLSACLGRMFNFVSYGRDAVHLHSSLLARF